MPRMLQKSPAFVPPYYKFESVSLQRGVVQTIGSSDVLYLDSLDTD